MKGVKNMWVVYALLSAVFAALTSILAKVGIEGVNSNLATAIRTAVVLVMAWGMVFITGTQSGISGITGKSWAFLVLSGLATGASWLCYYKALEMGEVSKVALIDKLHRFYADIFAFIASGDRFCQVDYRRTIDFNRYAGDGFVKHGLNFGKMLACRCRLWYNRPDKHRETAGTPGKDWVWNCMRRWKTL